MKCMCAISCKNEILVLGNLELNYCMHSYLVFEMSQEMVKIHVILDMIDVCLPLLVC